MKSRSTISAGGIFRFSTRDTLGDVLSFGQCSNGITDQLFNDLLNSYFRNESQPTNWYIGLIDNSSFTGVSDDDTMSSHSGWIENTDYDEATRPEWAPESSTDKLLITLGSIAFSMNMVSSIQGFFVTSSSTKGGSTGVLLATGLANNVQSLQAGETMNVSYDLSARKG